MNFKKLFNRKTTSPRSILFVCTANITRSPVAEAMFRKLAEKSGETWKIASAGVKAVKGASANQVISFIMFQRGLPLYNHSSQPVTKKLLSKYMWIVVMEDKHRKAILKIDENLKDRVFLFRELTADAKLDDYNMPDPTGKDAQDFSQLFDILDKEMPRLYEAMNIRMYDEEWGVE
ncbi:hypothetical protein K9N50_12145 [bacterium]|nr:hypothetical protein [bacterium]